ncbi:ABC transporter ATP-binding protein [Clostridium botulinum]|uniref:Putative ABC transporter, ATP-binding/permease protein n=1 Tax=Clostridium botulinum (strain Langeland / NCTC 10281 / Type F) TaxID=441772 RepID=A7GER8_CLOBL|nr:ABC transporter ATP-binding protein [Clostridium botulinum]ABS39693.1 putative ABC transporter, ATP-binding/permease protein [Clostridium botulinum F str. Langeland]ADF99688.1 putative ABC transporter, ATP-binding/permease protein [Clostridium botulinum F str. 230613]KKM42735.1 ABC transporter [Clostridium botulinum]MBY6791747.1 ABC transporter ATP-binding protein [Clostridium botulinum]MBY6936984.1 ABC transporter ATP-binding protein [Clostridium botulinum]
MKKKDTGIKRLIPYLKKYNIKIILAILLIIVASCLIALSPTLEGMITTQLFSDITKGQRVNFSRINRIILTLICVYAAGALSNCAYQFLLTDAIQNAMVDLRNDVEGKIKKLPIAYFDRNALGDILSRVSNDVETISNALQQSFAQILNAVLGLSLAVFMMFKIQWVMALSSIAIILVSGIISKVIVKKSQPIFQKQQNALGHLNGIVQEKFTGFNEIKLFGKQEDALAEFMNANEELCENGFKAQFISGLMSPLVAFVTYIGIGCVAIAGAFYAIGGIITVGQLQAFIRYIWQVNQPMSQITQLSSAIQSSVAAVHRVFEFLNEEEESEGVELIKPDKEVYGNVSFENVEFSYTKEKPLLHDLNVQVKSGQMVAIVGPTGVGKTTLINLLMRFYDVTGGSIKIDGVDIQHMKRNDLRAKFGMVLQDTWLFNGSIKENIAYGKEGATEEEIIDAAKVANVHHFITTLPEGYNMILNEEANNISQGEKQLLTIARSILCNPPIMILDEATSSVDTRLEQKLQDAMRNIMKGRTSFVIAHRLSTIKNADLILVMKDGNIVEQGTHNELLKKKGYYEQLYHAQFADLA